METLSGSTDLLPPAQPVQSSTVRAFRMNHQNLSKEELETLTPIFEKTILEALENSKKIELRRALRLTISKPEETIVDGDQLLEGKNQNTNVKPPSKPEPENTELILIDVDAKTKNQSLKTTVKQAFINKGISPEVYGRGVVLNTPRFTGKSIFDMIGEEEIQFSAMEISRYRSNRLESSETFNRLLNACENSSFIMSVSSRTPGWMAIDPTVPSSLAALNQVKEVFNEEMGRLERGEHGIDLATLYFANNQSMKTTTITVSPITQNSKFLLN